MTHDTETTGGAPSSGDVGHRTARCGRQSPVSGQDQWAESSPA